MPNDKNTVYEAINAYKIDEIPFPYDSEDDAPELEDDFCPDDLIKIHDKV